MRSINIGRRDNWKGDKNGIEVEEDRKSGFLEVKEGKVFRRIRIGVYRKVRGVEDKRNFSRRCNYEIMVFYFKWEVKVGV